MMQGVFDRIFGRLCKPGRKGQVGPLDLRQDRTRKKALLLVGLLIFGFGMSLGLLSARFTRSHPIVMAPDAESVAIALWREVDDPARKVSLCFRLPSQAFVEKAITEFSTETYFRALPHAGEEGRRLDENVVLYYLEEHKNDLRLIDHREIIIRIPHVLGAFEAGRVIFGRSRFAGLSMPLYDVESVRTAVDCSSLGALESGELRLEVLAISPMVESRFGLSPWVTKAFGFFLRLRLLRAEGEPEERVTYHVARLLEVRCPGRADYREQWRMRFPVPREYWAKETRLFADYLEARCAWYAELEKWRDDPEKWRPVKPCFPCRIVGFDMSYDAGYPKEY